MSSPLRALARREVLSALRSPRYYILLSFYAFVQGYLFCLLFLDDGAQAFRQLTREAAFLLLLAAPLLTAGSLAGERDSGELRTLLAEPIDEWTLVAGKALGSFLLLLPLPLLSLIPALAASLAAGAAWAPMATGVAGLVLVAAACAAAGLFTSSFASHPAAAAVSALGLLLGLGFLGVQTARAEEAVSFMLGSSGPGALNPFWLADFLFRGVLDTRPIVLFPAATLLFLHLAVLVLKSRRVWFDASEGLEGRGWSRGILVARHLALAALPWLLLFALVHGVNVRCHRSWDLSGYLTLSPEALGVVASLPEPARIYRVPPRSGGRDRLADLLDELARTSAGSVILGTWSPVVHQGQLRPLGLLVRPADGVVVRLGSQVQALGMASLDVESRDAERAIVAALETMLPCAPRPSVVFTEGHDEPSLPILRRLLATAGLAAGTVDLRSAGAALPTTAVLVMAAPRTEPSAGETARISAHLDGGGSLLLCIDPDAGGAGRSVAALLGVTAETGVLHDPDRSLAGGGPTALLLVPTAGHPAAEGTGRSTVVVPGAMPVRHSLPVDDPLRRDLFVTLGSTRLVPPGTAGNFVVALTVEGPRVTRPFRAAVLGDADLFDDRLLGYETNAAFAVSLFSWLARRPTPDLVPREPYAVRPVIGPSGARLMLWTVAALPALALIGLGFVAWRAYRRQVSGRVAT